MSDLMIPGSGDGAENMRQEGAQQRTDGDAGAGRGQQQKRGEGGDILSEDECLRAIAHTARLTVLGVLKPAVANVARGAFRDILQHHKAKAKEAEKNISSSDILELLKKDPKLLSLLEPLLSQEQIDMIMKNV